MNTAAGLLALVVLGQALLTAWLVWPHASAEEKKARAERMAFLELLAEQNRQAAEERRSLADRIQHPERVQVRPVSDYEPPVQDEQADLALAYVGQVVPEHVQIETERGDAQ